MSNELQVALVSGPAYDPLYGCLPAFTEGTGVKVNVSFRGDHPTLNQHLAELKDVPYDLVSTPPKYAPSQLDFLAPLNKLVDTALPEDFVPLLLELATIDEKLYSI